MVKLIKFRSSAQVHEVALVQSLVWRKKSWGIRPMYAWNKAYSIWATSRTSSLKQLGQIRQKSLVQCSIAPDSKTQISFCCNSYLAGMNANMNCGTIGLFTLHALNIDYIFLPVHLDNFADLLPLVVTSDDLHPKNQIKLSINTNTTKIPFVAH